MRATLSLLCLLTLTTCLCASDHKARGRSAWAWAAASSNSSESPNSSTAAAPTVKQSLTVQPEALAEVNEARAKKGLPPLIHDPLLSQAAYKAAQLRASRGISGHLPESDFTCLPAGAKADSAGCAALEPSWGWQSCCWDDPQYTHAGAAWVMGSDGLRYNHIFVRTESVATTPKQQPEMARAEPTGEVMSMGTCANGSCGVSTVQQSSRLFGRRRR